MAPPSGKLTLVALEKEQPRKSDLGEQVRLEAITRTAKPSTFIQTLRLWRTQVGPPR
jgi:hypothetical protein